MLFPCLVLAIVNLLVNCFLEFYQVYMGIIFLYFWSYKDRNPPILQMRKLRSPRLGGTGVGCISAGCQSGPGPPRLILPNCCNERTKGSMMCPILLSAKHVFNVKFLDNFLFWAYISFLGKGRWAGHRFIPCLQILILSGWRCICYCYLNRTCFVVQ